MGNRLSVKRPDRADSRISEGARNQTYNSGFNYIVKARYVPCGSGEIPLRKGDIVKVIKQSEDEAYLYVERLNEAK